MRNFLDLFTKQILVSNNFLGLWRLGIGILSVAIATLLKLLLKPYFQVESPFLLYFAAVMVSSWYGGWRGSILAVVLAALMSDYYFLNPTHTLLISNFKQILPLGIFIGEGLLIAGMISALRESIQRVQERTAELEQAKNNTQSTLNLLNGILEGTNDLLMASDLDYRFITFNTAYKQEFTKIFGLEPEIGMSILDAVAHLPTEQEKIKGFWSRALQGEQFSIIDDFGDPNLERHYYEINFSPIKNENNQLIGACHLVRNVTERIRMEERIRNLNQELEERVIERTQALEIEIQERIKIEAFLRESTAILNAINNTTSTLIYAKDLEGRYLFANPANLAVLGKPEAEVIGKSPTEYLSDSKQGEQIKANDRLVIETGAVQVYEETVDLLAGRRTFLSTKSPYRDKDGNIIGLIGVSTDISDRIQFEALLEAKNREITNVLESITDGFLYVDQDWRYIYVNPKAEQILGKSQSELIGKSVWEVFPELIDSPIYSYTHKAMAKQISMQYEQFYPMFGNKWLTVRLYPSPERLTTYLLDITERKQAEIALCQSEAHFRNLANSMPQIVWTANPDGTIDYYNQRVAQFSGLVQQQNGTWQWQPVIHPDEEQHTIEAWQHAVATGEIYECEYRVQKIDGEFRWHLSRGIPVKDEQGYIVKWYGTATDIHTQKQYQAERELLLRQEQQARTEAESANRMKDEFLATLSHELRTPMTAMLGWTSMLRTRKLNEAITARALETIERASRTLHQLVEDILDVSRIIRGKVRLSFQPLQLQPIIAQALETVQPTAAAKDIQLLLEPLPETVLKVMGDSRRLEQIVWNLLSNAIKFSSNGGCVTVRLSRLEGTGDKENKEDKGYIFDSHSSTVVGAGLDNNSNLQPITSIQHPPGQHSPIPIQNPKSSSVAARSTIRNSFAQIQVTDTGIGIAPEFLPYVFDHFRQADSSITRSHGGLGLGLAIVRHLVELHGGTVSVHSLGEGLGATFTVQLPLVVESDARGDHQI